MSIAQVIDCVALHLRPDTFVEFMPKWVSSFPERYVRDGWLVMQRCGSRDPKQLHRSILVSKHLWFCARPSFICQADVCSWVGGQHVSEGYLERLFSLTLLHEEIARHTNANSDKRVLFAHLTRILISTHCAGSSEAFRCAVWDHCVFV